MRPTKLLSTLRSNCWIQRVKSLMSAWRRAALVALLMLVLLVAGGLAATTNWLGSLGATSHGQASPAANSTSALYECELSYLQLDSSLISFSINYLDFEEQPAPVPISNASEPTTGGFRVARLAANSTPDELVAKLDPRLPFVFFINGFNSIAPGEEIESTWLYDVAENFARRVIEHRSAKRAAAAKPRNLMSRIQHFIGSTMGMDRLRASLSRGKPDRDVDGEARNVILLTWSIPELFVKGVLSLVPAYYKTVANYELILDNVSDTILRIVQLVERTMQFKTPEARRKHYEQFHFYGHSLGSHILTDAIVQAGNKLSARADIWPVQTPVRFGKLMGLDPASPCFTAPLHGLSMARLSENIAEIAVLHSNAGFAGVPDERAHLEIVLNGGTFQPGCSWYDFTCSHQRSTDILSYRDDECQMVAYRCTSHAHFKQGACDTCRDTGPDTPRGSCVLVNLPEQHRDLPHVLAFARQHSEKRARKFWWSQRSRQAEQAPEETSVLSGGGPTNATKDATSTKVSEAKSWKYYQFYHVNTNANFRFGRKSHCLQHYQLRLLVYGRDASLHEKCRAKLKDDIALKLFYESASGSSEPAPLNVSGSARRPEPDRRLVSKMVRADGDPRVHSDTLRLDTIIKHVFYTGLANFEANPRLFVGAGLVEPGLARLAECYKSANATDGPSFLLDIAFMSHTNPEIRQAFSSVLCGQLPLETPPAAGSKLPDGDSAGDSLTLSSCKQSEVRNVSAEIDRLLDQIKLNPLEETWKVSLLNSLFALLTEWEPF